MEIATAFALQGYGLAHRHELLALGVSSAGISRAVRNRELVRVHPAVYLRGQLGGISSIAAAARSLRGAASHLSAALCHDFELSCTPSEIHVTIDRRRGGLSRQGVTVHRADVPAEIPPGLGFLVTPPLQTVLDCAVSLPLRHAVVVADSALRQGKIGHEELLLAAARRVGRNGGKIRRVAELADPKAGSVLESLNRVLLVTNGLAPDETQFKLYADGRLVAVADFAYRRRRLLVESDGFTYHSSPEQLNKDARRGNLYLEQGWDLLRFTWHDVVRDPDYVLATVRRELAKPPRAAT